MRFTPFAPVTATSFSDFMSGSITMLSLVLSPSVISMVFSTVLYPSAVTTSVYFPAGAFMIYYFSTFAPRGTITMLGFNDILGHEQIKEHFRNAVQTGKISHAYILSGEAGMGRKIGRASCRERV